MQAVTTIGLDIAKSVFRVHGVDEHGNVVVRRQLRRRQVLAFFEKLPLCLVGLEACASSGARRTSRGRGTRNRDAAPRKLRARERTA
jgi:transposase